MRFEKPPDSFFPPLRDWKRFSRIPLQECAFGQSSDGIVRENRLTLRDALGRWSWEIARSAW